MRRGKRAEQHVDACVRLVVVRNYCSVSEREMKNGMNAEEKTFSLSAI